MEGRGSAEVIHPVKMIYSTQKEKLLQETKALPSGVSVKEFIFKLMSELKEYRKREEFHQEHLQQNEEREEELGKALQKTTQIISDLQNEMEQKNKEINFLQENHKIQISAFETEKATWIIEKNEYLQEKETLKRTLNEQQKSLRKNNQLIQQLKEKEVKSGQVIVQLENMIQQLQIQQYHLEEEMNRLSGIEERGECLTLMIQHYQSSEEQVKKELEEYKMKLIETEESLFTLREKEVNLNKKQIEKEKIITTLQEKEYIWMQDMENIKNEYQQQLQRKEEEVQKMNNTKKTWFNWFGSNEIGRMTNEIQTLLEQEKLNAQQLEQIKAQIQSMANRLERTEELNAAQEDHNSELQLWEAKEMEWKKLIEQKEQEINSLKDKEKSYLQKIQQFTSNLQTLQQSKSTQQIVQTSPSTQTAHRVPSNKPVAQNNSPFFREHIVPPRPEDYFKNQY